MITNNYCCGGQLARCGPPTSDPLRVWWLVKRHWMSGREWCPCVYDLRFFTDNYWSHMESDSWTCRPGHHSTHSPALFTVSLLILEPPRDRSVLKSGGTTWPSTPAQVITRVTVYSSGPITYSVAADDVIGGTSSYRYAARRQVGCQWLQNSCHLTCVVSVVPMTVICLVS